MKMWVQAKRVCEANGGSLATIRSQADNDELKRLLETDASIQTGQLLVSASLLSWALAKSAELEAELRSAKHLHSNPTTAGLDPDRSSGSLSGRTGHQ